MQYHSPVQAPAAGLRVAVVAGHPTVRTALQALLEGDAKAIVVAAIDDPVGLDMIRDDIDAALVDVTPGPGALPMLPAGLPAVLLWDAPVPVLERRAATAHLLRDAESPEARAALNAVVHGLSVFDPAMLAAAHLVSAGEWSDAAPGGALTPREHDVLALLADGMTNKAIARRLGISDHTVKFHVGAILAKLGAESRTEAVTIAARSGMLPL